MNSETKAWTENVVFDAAKQLLDERVHEKPATEVWVTASEIAHSTGLDKDVVTDALQGLGEGRLHVRPAETGDDVEVLGVDHGQDADSSQQPVGR